MTLQPSLFDLSIAPRNPLPEGFRYQAGLVTAREERDMVARLQTLAFAPYEHLGCLGYRRVAAFDWRRDDGAMVETGEGVPDFSAPPRMVAKRWFSFNNSKPNTKHPHDFPLIFLALW